MGPARIGAGPGRFMGPGGVGEKAYTVDRTMLRSLLLLDQADVVKFGKVFDRYECTSAGVRAFFLKIGPVWKGRCLLG